MKLFSLSRHMCKHVLVEHMDLGTRLAGSDRQPVAPKVSFVQ